MTEYVLITTAKNEEAYIAKTIRSVLAQTRLPTRWIIVSDGSSDRTDEIVRKMTGNSGFVELVKTSGGNERSFASKARAFKYGYERLTGLNYNFIGNLDADISLEPTYYEQVLLAFHDNERLGVAGGVRHDLFKSKLFMVRSSRTSVGGPLQMFRRECYEAIGGYQPLTYGGIDALAEVTARMMGWEVQSFSHLVARHHRATGTASEGTLHSMFRAGIRDFMLGYHPLFQIARIMSFHRGPFLAQVDLRCRLAWSFGYILASLKRYPRPVSDDFISFIRTEQLDRIRSRFLTRNHLNLLGNDAPTPKHPL